MHVSRDELEKKYILKKFFNFSEAFIIHAKISHRNTHTHTCSCLLSPPYTPLSCRQMQPKLFCVKREILTQKIRNGKSQQQNANANCKQ